MTSERIAKVEGLYGAWESSWESMCASYFDLFKPDCVWENQGFPTTHGPQEAVDLVVKPCNEKLGMDRIRVENLHLGEVGDAVCWERIDHIVRADDSVAISIPVVGIMEFDAELMLQRWREYFDSRPIFDFMAAQELPSP
jgi:limonene-1,2-epoxide hydrolase